MHTNRRSTPSDFFRSPGKRWDAEAESHEFLQLHGSVLVRVECVDEVLQFHRVQVKGVFPQFLQSDLEHRRGYGLLCATFVIFVNHCLNLAPRAERPQIVPSEMYGEMLRNFRKKPNVSFTKKQ